MTENVTRVPAAEITGEVIESTVPASSDPVEPANQPKAQTKKPNYSLATVEPSEMAWQQALEPRDLAHALELSRALFASRMFGGYGTPEAVLSTVMLGRELGLGTMASLRGIHNIKNKHALSADLMVALVMRSGLCDYFEPVELSQTKSTYRAKRTNRPELVMSFSIDEAVAAGLVKDDSGWKKWPLDMVKARCIARLARTLWPDVMFGLYTPEELSGVSFEESR